MFTKTQNFLVAKKITIATIFSLLSFFALTGSALAQDVKDTIPPDDVENVKVVASDSEVTLSWDVATDNVRVTGYKIYYGTQSVTGGGSDYNLAPIDIGDLIQYTVTGLTNNTKYYFAVTAVDAIGNESESYSVEVSATPYVNPEVAPKPIFNNTNSGAIVAGTGETLYGSAEKSIEKKDSVGPVVVSAEAISLDTVRVIFSEGILLSGENPKINFDIIEKNNPENFLIIKKVEFDSTDLLQQIVILTTAIQNSGTIYTVTAGVNITDKNGNPIASGITDSADFVGSALASLPVETPKTETLPVEAPKFISIIPISNSSLDVEFSENIILPKDPAEAFEIFDSKGQLLKILKIEAEKDEENKDKENIVKITTDNQNAGEVYNLIIKNGIVDIEGNAFIPDEKNNLQFIAKIMTVVDVIAPADVTNFIAKVKDTIVTLSWTASIDKKDVVKQILYQGKNKNNFAKIADLGASVSSYQVADLQAGLKYFFKLTTVDEAGNESKGVITSVALPASGAGIGIAFGLSSLAVAAWRRKKK